MPPHCSQAGPRSRPDIFAGRTGGVSVIAAAARRPLAAAAFAVAPPLPACRGRCRAVGGAGGVGGDAEAELRGLRFLLGAHLRGHDPQFLERVGVLDEAARDPAHDVVGHRFGEGDLRVAGDALRLEAHVAELAHEVFERHAVLEAERDRRREGVHQPPHRRALLADVGEEDLADRAVLVFAGGDVALVAGDRELVGDRFALARHPFALRRQRPRPRARRPSRPGRRCAAPAPSSSRRGRSPAP